MSLHDRIMELPKGVLDNGEYAMGYESACETAAQLATEVDELMEEMAKALGPYSELEVLVSERGRIAKAALAKYNAYKEQS